LRNILENLSGANVVAHPDTIKITGQKPESVTNGTPGVLVRNHFCLNIIKIPVVLNVSVMIKKDLSSGMRPSSATG
jgi:hypothetical protein